MGKGWVEEWIDWTVEELISISRVVIKLNFCEFILFVFNYPDMVNVLESNTNRQAE